MTRRIYFILVISVLCAAAAWPKWKPEEQEYLDGQFRAIQEQVKALKAQVDSLNAKLGELRQSQDQLEQVLLRQERNMTDMEHLVTTVRTGNEECVSALKATLVELRAEQQKAFDALGGKGAQPAQVAAGGANTVPTTRTGPAIATGPHGYVTLIQGDIVTVDLGSSQGIRPGARLLLYKSSDQMTRVGELEVTQVVDAGNSRARIVNTNPGVKPEFSDIVRVQ